jgi:predicted ATP-grasp superfamily ATP-dependent carboligase
MADHPRAGEIREVAKRTVKVLGCQGYVGVDFVVRDRITVVDVNPRITTSLTGIAAVMKEEIADLLIRGSHGELPPQVHLEGHVWFSKTGEVTCL